MKLKTKDKMKKLNDSNDLENDNKIVEVSSQELNESKSISSTINRNLEQIQTIVMENEDINLINSSIKKNFLLSNLSKDIIDSLIKKLIFVTVNKGDVLYKEGDNGYFFFIIKSGKFESFSKLNVSKSENRNSNNQSIISDMSNKVLILKSGDTFGEESILNMSKRNSTVKCVENGELFLLDERNFRDIVYNLNRLNLQEKLSFLKTIDLFNFIEQFELNNICDCLIKCEFENNKVIAQRGRKCDCMYIVIEGSLECIEKNKIIVDEVKEKEYIGEILMTFDKIWPFNLIVKSKKCICYQLLKSEILKYFHDDFFKRFINSIIMNSISKTKKFKYLIENVDNIFYKILQTSETKFYKKGDLIAEKYAVLNNKLIIVLFGLISFENNENAVGKRGDFLFEENLLINKNILGNLVAKTQLVITQEFAIDKFKIMILKNIYKDEEIEEPKNQIIKTDNINRNNISIESIEDIDCEKKKKDPKTIEISQLLEFYERITHLHNQELFKNISDSDLLQIGKLMKNQTYYKNDIIIKENTKGEFLYFLNKGSVRVINSEGKKLREYHDDCICFGEISLLTNKLHTATVIALEETSCYLLSKNDFEKVIDNNMREYLTKKIEFLKHTNVELDDLYYIDKLGDGKFGHVSLVHNSKGIFAIKAVNKFLAQRKKMLQKYFIKERNVLLSLVHPFIIKLIKTFQNQDYIFYLMEYVKGCELASYINNRKNEKLRNKYETQFYSSIILLIINYLHKKKIAHRDIKGENIMIQENGYLKLIDFNTCVEIKDLTKTITGTPHYMAPELILGKGYNFCVDYWSTGVLIYKLYFGYFPFGNDMYDPMNIYYDIVKSDLILPFNTEKNFSEFITKILNKDPKYRLCSLNSAKNEKFFYCFNWDDIIDMKMDPPFIPTNKYQIKECLNNKEKKYTDMVKHFEMTSLSLSSSKDNNNNNSQNSLWAEDF